LKVRKGKAVSVALYGDIDTVKPVKEVLTIEAADGGILIKTNQPVFIGKNKIKNVIDYLERFKNETG